MFNRIYPAVGHSAVLYAREAWGGTRERAKRLEMKALGFRFAL